ncbi:hypothetical protein BDQ12DRAFT_669000 [Crucibulum laeve]|uniref:Glycan binding protein Y3-like domain-containing protein n=1 Tax=Crucibulum laeve TaxID=68775 RepID=A0A5C3LQI5_9AGAR|nr:hypothetical protein BDQ12DRAFT_669000 [Crucibulum laeve]
MTFNANTILTATVFAFTMTSVYGAAFRRTCYTAGTVGNECAQFVNNFCSRLEGNVAFRNNLARCYNTPNFKCDFGAFYEFPLTSGSTSPATPAKGSCVDTLTNVTNTCGGFGGFGNTAGGAFTFTLDPNQGQCGQLEAPGN